MNIVYYAQLNAEQGNFGHKVWGKELYLPTFWRELLGSSVSTAIEFVEFIYSSPTRVQEFLGWEKLEMVERAIVNLKLDINPVIGNELRAKFPWWRQI